MALAAWALAPTARAQAAPRAPSDSTAHGFLRSPSGVMVRSLLVPGWGQATNGVWIKAALAAGGEVALGAALVHDTRRLSRLDAADPEYARLYDRRQRNAWWLGGLVGISMVDAYVDAHLKHFDIEVAPEPEDASLSIRVRARLP